MTTTKATDSTRFVLAMLLLATSFAASVVYIETRRPPCTPSVSDLNPGFTERCTHPEHELIMRHEDSRTIVECRCLAPSKVEKEED